jgi:hypothetical protein
MQVVRPTPLQQYNQFLLSLSLSLSLYEAVSLSLLFVTPSEKPLNHAPTEEGIF